MNIYDYSVNDTRGNKIPLSTLTGSVILIVNTATKCGLAPQFKELEILHQKYKDKGLVVIGFPSDQFLGQEPETNDTMVNVCQINFGVTFQLTEKIDVNGENTHPIFKYIKEQSSKFKFKQTIKWNFTKFLIDKNGNLYKRYSPTINPTDIETDIIKLLK